MEITCKRADEFPADLYKSISAFRRKVFIERLGWNLNCEPGYEEDQFDRPDTVCIVAQSETDGVIGCGRLLPTTKPYLLGEVFPHLLNGVIPPCCETVWELSRFAVVRPSRHASQGKDANLAERLLLHALLHCQRLGATELLAVSTLPVERLMLRAGVDVQRLGPPSIVDGQPVLAFMISVNEQSIVSLLAFDEANEKAGKKQYIISQRQAEENPITRCVHSEGL
jgi:acyl homoserine lactone synthase